MGAGVSVVWVLMAAMGLAVEPVEVPRPAAPVIAPTHAAVAGEGPGYPRLFAMCIGGKDYDEPAFQERAARFNAVLLGFYPGWKEWKLGATAERDVVKSLKRRNPALLVGQYTILSEAQPTGAKGNADDDVSRKIEAEGWWLRNAKGERVRWTEEYGAFDVNTTLWAKPDAEGKRISEWLAERDYRVFFKPVPELDFWMFDNVFGTKGQRVRADFDLDGREDDQGSARCACAFMEGHYRHFAAARRLAPGLMFVGNTDGDLSEPEHAGSLQGAIIEGAMGTAYALDKAGWSVLKARYDAVMKNTAAPHLVVVNVHGRHDDYRLMRYGLCTTLMHDGYFSYSGLEGYGTPPWFDEFGVSLGGAVDAPVAKAGGSGVWVRRFERGLVLLNPQESAAECVVPDGYRRIKGTQAPAVNSGEPVRGRVSVPAKDGLVLVVAEVGK
jgi:hypothetical protein